MSIYQVITVDTETGAEGVLPVEAPTPAEAIAKASRMGYTTGGLVGAAPVQLRPTSERAPIMQESPWLRSIASSGLIRTPVRTIASGVFLALVLAWFCKGIWEIFFPMEFWIRFHGR